MSVNPCTDAVSSSVASADIRNALPSDMRTEEAMRTGKELQHTAEGHNMVVKAQLTSF